RRKVTYTRNAYVRGSATAALNACQWLSLNSLLLAPESWPSLRIRIVASWRSRSVSLFEVAGKSSRMKNAKIATPTVAEPSTEKTESANVKLIRGRYTNQ